MVLSSTYDADGNRKSLSATIGGTADFVNTYSYDSSNREVQVKQGPAAAGTSNVNSKTVNFTYDADGEFGSIARVQRRLPIREVTSVYSYDSFGRLTTLTQGNDTNPPTSDTAYANDIWTYDADSEVKSFADSVNPGDELLGLHLRQRWAIGIATRAALQPGQQYVRPRREFEQFQRWHNRNDRWSARATRCFSTARTTTRYNADGNVVLSWASSNTAEKEPTSSDGRGDRPTRGMPAAGCQSVTNYASGSDFNARTGRVTL